MKETINCPNCNVKIKVTDSGAQCESCGCVFSATDVDELKQAYQTIERILGKQNSDCISGTKTKRTVTLDNYDKSEFEIKNKKFEKYRGNGGNIVIPSGVTVIAKNAFKDCTTLIGVDIPFSVTEIGENAFENCQSIKSISVPDSVASIGGSAFKGCRGLQSVTLPNGLTTISPALFSGCISLKDIRIPSNVTSIEYSAFDGCRNLAEVQLPNSLTCIENYAFRGCSNLTAIDIPSSVTSFGSCVFDDCAKLTSLTVQEGNPQYFAQNGCLIDNESKTLITVCGGLSEVEIHTGVIHIADYALQPCKNVRKVSISCGVTDIGQHAFDGCSSLKDVAIPDGVTKIGKYAFRGCSSLKNVEIPGSLSTIDEYLFGDCTGLESVVISDGVTYISLRAFSGCTALTDIVIPSSIRSVCGFAFENCSSLTSIEIPKNAVVGSRAFYGCSGLVSLTIPFDTLPRDNLGDIARTYRCGDVLVLESYLFGSLFGCAYDAHNYSDFVEITQYCDEKEYRDYSRTVEYQMPKSLSHLTINGGEIADFMLVNCNTITSITITDDVEFILGNSFKNLTNLTNIVFKGNKQRIKELTKDISVPRKCKIKYEYN